MSGEKLACADHESVINPTHSYVSGTPPAPDSNGSQQIESVISREQATVLSHGADDATNKEGVLLGEREDPVALIRWNTASTRESVITREQATSKLKVLSH
ncbi:hypothetical protein Tco_0360139 [Tanacetum coccineum]